MDPERLYQDLVLCEKKLLTPYRDTNGYWTIGVGHLLGGGSPRMTHITEAECRALYDYDVRAAAELARDVIGPDLWPYGDDVRERALVNMAFNRGGHMRNSTTITPAIRAALAGDGSWDAVKRAIEDSPWAKQVKSRAVMLSHMLVTGTDYVP